ncbi:MAG TPA: winged helix-turn-helix domain-containing protein [Caulobacteraceae bacterium]|jgi:DNA-binding response OmpR family regulator|nr:winged helix-turn-helix domain-containing protein [Caulobacteraceae bacterium]
MHILYVHDGGADAHLIKALRELGHVVDIAAGEADGLAQASLGAYEAVTVEVQRDGVDRIGAYAAALAEAGVRSVLVAVAPASVPAARRAELLRMGADLCFTRPVDIREFAARLRALAGLSERRRIAPDARSRLELLRDGRTVRLGHEEVELSQQQFQLLVYLAKRPGQVVKTDELQRHVWGDDSDVSPQTVSRAVRRLQQRLTPLSGQPPIEVIPGHGFAFRGGPPAS